jgi:hypothetical protein
MAILNKKLIKKYAKHITTLSPDLSTEVALYKIIEHDTLRYIKFIPEDLKKDLLKKNDLKYFNIQHLLAKTPYTDIKHKDINLIIEYIKTENHLKLLNLLDSILSTRSLNIYLVRRVLKHYNYTKFKCLDQYVKNNKYVSQIVANFLDYFKDFLPSNIVEILVDSKIDLKYFGRLFDKIDIRSYENITEDLMIFNSFRESAIYQGYRKHDFLVKYVKREDFEFYLRIENSEKLSEYFCNGISSDHRYYPHMHILNLFGDNQIIFSRNYLFKKNFSINKEKFYGIIRNIDLGNLFVRDVDILLLKLIIDISCHLRDIKIIESVFRLNNFYKNGVINSSLYYSLVNNNMIEYLSDNLSKFVFEVDTPVFDLLNDKVEYVDLKDYEKYLSTDLKQKVISKIIRKLDINEVVTELFKKYEDERSVYYEILYEKSLIKEYDLRIFDIESNNKFFYLTKSNIIENIKSDKIYEKLKKSDLFFKYCFSHDEYKLRYLENINKEECTVEEGRNIYKILSTICSEYKITDRSGNLIYLISVADFNELDDIVEDKLLLVNLVYNIRYNDGLYLFYKYADYIIESYIKDNSNVIKKSDRDVVNYDCMNYLSNKYVIHVLTIKDKYFRYILKFIDSLDYKYIKILIYLLNDTNINTVSESKRLLKNMKCTNTDIDNIKTQIIESFICKMNVNNTLLSILSLQINYMIDDTSLYLLIELVRRYIKEFKEYIFVILSRIGQIVINKEYFKKEVLAILCSFVIQNNFYTEECVDIVKILHDLVNEDVKIEDLDLLICNIDSDLRVSFFLVEVLKIFNNETLTRQVVAKNVANSSNFLAYAFDLEIFIEYMDNYLPVLKRIYTSRDNKVAVHAFSKLINKEDIFNYIIEESFLNSLTRMSCIEILSIEMVNSLPNNFLSILYIYKYDSNGLIRKKVNEILKNKIENYNVLLKLIYKDILNYLNKYYLNIPDVVNNVVDELVIKYSSIIDFEYCKINYSNIYECILVHGIRINKLQEECKEYLLTDINVEICSTLLRNKNEKDFIFRILSKNIKGRNNKDNPLDNDRFTKSLDVLKDNPLYIFDLLMFDEDLINVLEILALLTEDDLKRLFKHVINSKSTDSNSLVYLLQNIKNINIGDYDIDTIYLYIKNTHSEDGTLYKKVFSKLDNDKLQCLITKKNYKFIVDVSYKNITEYDRLVNVLLSSNTVTSIERIREIYELVNDSLKENIRDYLMYNFLIYENRSTVRRIFRDISYEVSSEESIIKDEIIRLLIK